MPSAASIYQLRLACRLCGQSLLDPILDLGTLALPTFPTVSGDEGPPETAPIALCQCRSCFLVQLRHTVYPDRLYRHYWYRSGINEAMQQELTSVVREALLTVSVFPGHDLVLDVGANDGFLLSQYPQQRAHWDSTRIAFEPAVNLQPACRPHCEVLVPDYFPPHDLDLVRGWEGRIKVLTSIAMFYDLDDPKPFVQAVDRLLHQEGVWILQLQDLAQMVEATAFDNLCHEHLTYWSLDTFITLLREAGADLHVTHVERRNINGGSLRIHVRRLYHAVDGTVGRLHVGEREHTGWEALEQFAWRAGQVQAQIRDAVHAWDSQGAVIDLYGASTKANTLLQTCFLTASLVRQAWERNPEKIGRLTATGIPIVSEEDGRADPPAVLLAGIWQFRDVILARESAYLAGGGRILFPLPVVDLVTVERDAAS